MAWRSYAIRRATRVETAQGPWKLEIDGKVVLYGSEAQVRTVATDVASARWMIDRVAGVVTIDEGHGERVLETYGTVQEADAHLQRDRRPVTELFVGLHTEDTDQPASPMPWRICSEGQTLKAFA